MFKNKGIALVLALIVLLSGCGSEKKEAGSSKIEEKPLKQETVSKEDTENEKFFADFVNTKQRPIAVMVDNDNDEARPQAGLDEAYLIYEMVIEGGATRFMALFRGADVEKIGPVRSSRHYFLDYALENDVIYTHYGWSPNAMQDISSLGVKNINGLVEDDGVLFWRERKYSGDWHSSYTAIGKLRGRAESKGYALETEHKGPVVYSKKTKVPVEGEVANEVDLNYSPIYTTSYIYDKEKAVYEKHINGKAHLMQNGNSVQVENILIQFIADYSLGDGTHRRNMDTTGSGSGYYITKGNMEKITWEKEARGKNTVYKRENGEDLLINPGKTIVNIISATEKVSVK